MAKAGFETKACSSQEPMLLIPNQFYLSSGGDGSVKK